MNNIRSRLRIVMETRNEQGQQFMEVIFCFLFFLFVVMLSLGISQKRQHVEDHVQFTPSSHSKELALLREGTDHILVLEACLKKDAQKDGSCFG